MKVIQQMYYGTTREWENKNPILYQATIAIEEIVEVDERGFHRWLVKFGDGIRRWQQLPYFNIDNINGLAQHIAEAVEAEAVRAMAAEEALRLYAEAQDGRIIGLEERVTVLETPRHFAVNIPIQNPTQEELQAVYETVSGNTGPASEQTVLDDVDNNRTFTWFSLSAEWVVKETLKFKNGVAGLIVGSDDDGNVSANADHTGSVAGWGALKSRVSDTENGIASHDGRIEVAEQEIVTQDSKIDNLDSRLNAVEVTAPTTSQKAAMAGTSGTPSNTNRFVTDSDPRLEGGGSGDGDAATLQGMTPQSDWTSGYPVEGSYIPKMEKYRATDGGSVTTIIDTSSINGRGYSGFAALIVVSWIDMNNRRQTGTYLYNQISFEMETGQLAFLSGGDAQGESVLELEYGSGNVNIIGTNNHDTSAFVIQFPFDQWI